MSRALNMAQKRFSSGSERLEPFFLSPNGNAFFSAFFTPPVLAVYRNGPSIMLHVSRQPWWLVWHGHSPLKGASLRMEVLIVFSCKRYPFVGFPPIYNLVIFFFLSIFCFY